MGNFFFPDEDRYVYAEGLSRGGYLVRVTGLSGTKYDTALDILDDEGSINLEEREQSWRSEGWGGYETSSYATSGTGASMAGGSLSGSSMTSVRAGDLDTLMEHGAQTGQRKIHSDDETIPALEERIRIGKRETV